MIDTAMATILGFRPTEDNGRMLENIVFCALKRKYDDIYYYKEKHECDFVIREDGRINEVIQVTTSLEENNRHRELSGLIEAMDAFELDEGTIITEYQDEEENVEGRKVKIVPAWKWFLENEK